MHAATVDLLVVDDEDVVRRALERLFTLEGFVVAGAPGGLEALAMIDAGLRPKVIFADLMMPDVNGAELLQRVRRAPELAGIHVYIMSGGHEGVASADGYIEKPFDLDSMFAIVKRHCREA